ncbi:hypothetical protein ES702_01371 [subsurface metagenome]
MKKIPTMLIIAFFLVSFFLVLSHFIDFKEWTKQTRASFEVLSVLGGLNILIFSIFGSLSLLKHFFPKFINRYVTGSINDLVYIIEFCIILTLIIPLIIFKSSLTWFTWKYSVISFIYIFGVTTICIEIFKLRR